MKIGLFLAEIWPKTSRHPIVLGSKKGGALIGGGALNGEFTVYPNIKKKERPYNLGNGSPGCHKICTLVYIRKPKKDD